MTLTEFVNKWNGKTADYDNTYGGQCVDLARYYWKEVCEISQPRGVTGAKDFWTNFETDINLNNNFKKIANTPTGMPNAGDVMIWGSAYGPYGHIAIVTEATVNNFKCFSQNDPTGSVCGIKTYNSYKGVLGWFNPNKSPESDSYKGYDLSNKDSMKVAVDVLVQLQSGELVRKEDLANLSKEIEALKNNQKVLEGKVSDLEGQINTNEEIMEIGSQKLNLLMAENQKLKEDLEYYKPYKSRYEEALKKVPSSMTGSELIFLGIAKLIVKLKDKWK